MNQNINDLKVLFLRTSKAKLNGREVKGRVYIVAMARPHILLRSLDKCAQFLAKNAHFLWLYTPMLRKNISNVQS